MVRAIGLLFATTIQTPDTTTFRNPATAALMEQAFARHGYQDQLVRDYSALVRTRIDAGFGRSRFARIAPIVAHETAARIAWSLPNDLKVDVIGQRGVSIFDAGEVDAEFDRPWFIPRSLGDSIRLVDDELPATAALHPLAEGATRYYRYDIADSVTLSIPGRTVNAVAVRVEPKILGPSLVAGDLWLDSATAEVVRFTFVFVGEYMWDTPTGETAEDSAEVRDGNKWARRILKLEGDLEYALYEARYWMPYRQLLQLTVDIPWFLNVAIPVRFLTTFDDYEVNTSVLPVFEGERLGREADLDPDPPVTIALGEEEPDSARARYRRRRGRTLCPAASVAEEDGTCDRGQTGYYRVGESERGGRWEVHYPPEDSMRDYAWPDELTLGLSSEDEDRIHETIASLGAIQEQLPGEWVGRMPYGPAFERFSDIYRFNRVQGSSLGFGYQLRPGPRYTSLIGSARYGFSDKRPTASIVWRRDAPGGRLDLRAFRDMRDVEPWTGGAGFGNSMNGIFAGHDDADYVLTLGAGVSYRDNGRALFRDLTVAASVEQHRSVAAVARSGLNDALGGSGVFQPNTPVAEGAYGRLSVTRTSLAAAAVFDQGAETLVDLSDGAAAFRVWGTASIPFSVWRRTGELNLRSGVSAGDELEQMLFRAGGPQTVRGYPYNTRRGGGVWAAQLDVALRDRADWSPVVFVDVGDVWNRSSITPAPAPDGPLVGIGAGLSLIRGLIRFDLAKGLNPDGDLRFDLRFSAPR